MIGTVTSSIIAQAASVAGIPVAIPARLRTTSTSVPSTLVIDFLEPRPPSTTVAAKVYVRDGEARVLLGVLLISPQYIGPSAFRAYLHPTTQGYAALIEAKQPALELDNADGFTASRAVLTDAVAILVTMIGT